MWKCYDGEREEQTRCAAIFPNNDAKRLLIYRKKRRKTLKPAKTVVANRRAKI